MGRYIDALVGNMAPNSEAEEPGRPEIRDCSSSSWNACDEATMLMEAWSSDEEHEPLPHRQGEEAVVELRVRTVRRDWDKFWEFSRAALATTKSHTLSRARQSIMLSRA